MLSVNGLLRASLDINDVRDTSKKSRVRSELTYRRSGIHAVELPVAFWTAGAAQPVCARLAAMGQTAGSGSHAYR